MRDRILNALKESENTNMFNTSVIFKNNLTGKLSFYNGLTSDFEPITTDCFEWLRSNNYIVRERCQCQGDIRFIYGGTR